MIFAFKNRSYPWEFEAELKKALAFESGPHGGLLDEKTKVKNLMTLSLKKCYTSEILTTGMPDYPASRQSCTRLKKTNDAETVLVSE
jgi:hypothetical protein